MGHANSALQLRMEVTMALRNRPALDQLIRDQQDPASPRYQQWLTPQQFIDRFGPTRSDVDAVAQWLGAQGFTVTASSRAQRYIRFTGKVSDAERVFGADIMAFGDGSVYSNATDPAIPARFAGVIGAVGGLSNFLHSYAFVHGPGGSHLSAEAAPEWASGPLALLDSGPPLPLPQRGAISAVPNTTIGGVTAFAPADFYSFYDEANPLMAGHLNGSGGDCIAIAGASDFHNSAVSIFNTTFGLPDNSSSIPRVLVDGTNPGFNSAELESLLDVQWSHAVAPGAPLRFYLGDDSTASANGSIVDAIQRAVNDNTCGVISVSFGLCGGNASFYTGVVSPIYAQAVATTNRQSIFISSGDFGAAGIVFDTTQNACVPGSSRNINELGADPNVTQVGGTGFNPVFDGAGDNVGHVAEQAWNDPNTAVPPSPPDGGSTGGGVSAIYPKPAYQKGLGVPVGGRRDVPDVALIASAINPGVFLGFISGGSAAIGCCIGGTSLSAPAWAGISKLIAQLKHGRLGALNPRIYSLANAGLAASGFRDVTTGNNNFTYGTEVIGFNAGVGFDLATGWGTVDISTFANKFAGAATPTPTPTRKPSPTPTPLPPPLISSVPSIILVGDPFKITGNHFSAGAKINFFVATSGGPVNSGPLTPSFTSATVLIMPVPATVSLGQGFVDVQVVNTDQGFKASNLAPALLQGSAAAGIPSLTAINGMGLAATSKDPNFATNNVQTVVVQGKTVTLGGMGFDAVNGVAVNLFCACTGGKVGPFFVNPGPMLSASSIKFTLPGSGANAPPDGPGSFIVINEGAGHTLSKSSNAVSVPIGAKIAVSSVTQPLSTSPITVNGAGFSTLTVINFFNALGATSVNLGGLKPDGTAKIPLTLISGNQFTFTKPVGAMAGPSYVQAFNPPFVPFSSSGTGPGGAFTLK